jgi:protein-S-isoprenylcysteine O-methyltransferase Ste14
MKRLDLIERIALVVFYAALLWRLWPPEATGWLVILSEGMVLAFVLVRRPAEAISVSPREWAVAFAGSALPLFVTPQGTALAPEAVSVWLMGAGLVLGIGAKLSLMRSFGMVPANRGVKRWGLYRLVRHPMYLGYMAVHLGYFLAHPSWWNGALYLATAACQVARIFAEEKLLGQDEAYRVYAGAVRWRLVPGVF